MRLRSLVVPSAIGDRILAPEGLGVKRRALRHRPQSIIVSVFRGDEGRKPERLREGGGGLESPWQLASEFPSSAWRQAESHRLATFRDWEGLDDDHRAL